jgi:outer membrane receptor protein involved in Fe transport
MKKFRKNRIKDGLLICFTSIVIVVFFRLDAFSNLADSRTIKGRIIDSAENTPLPFSTVVLFSSDSVFVSGTIAAEDGTFEFGELQPGNYKVVVKFIGYNTKTINLVEFLQGQSLINLGDILLSQITNEIAEVTITGKKAQVESHPDKKVINITSGGITDGGVATDALVQVPSVTLDANRNVLLRGSTQFKVLIDGVPSPLDGNEALKGIPASTIDKIEVITNPSSSFDSEGTAGIINIILKKEKSASMSAQANLNLSSNGSRNETFSLMSKNKKLDYNLSFDDRIKKEISEATITNQQTETGSSNQLFSNYDYKLSMQIMKADASYQINKSNSIQGLIWLVGTNSNQTTSDVNSASPTIESAINSSRQGRGMMPQLRYNHKFIKEGANITLFSQYNQGSENSEQILSENDRNQQKVNMDIPFRFVMVREDLSIPLKNKTTFNSGLDYKYSGFDYNYNYYNADNENWLRNEDLSYESSFRSDITAAYLQLKANKAGFGFDAGLRAEYTLRTLSDDLNNDIYTYEKLSLFPSLLINQVINNKSSLLMSFSRRLNRPRLYQLNPGYNYSNPGFVTVGNYKLVPEFQNTIEVSYSTYGDKWNFNGTLYGKFTQNSIIQKSYMQHDTVVFTYQNALRDTRLGTELSLKWNPVKWFSSNLNGNLFNYRLMADEEADERQNTQYEASLNLTFTVLKGINIQSFSSLKSKSITADGYIKGYYTNDLAVSKQFFGDKLWATVKAVDIFNGVKEDETIENEFASWNRYYKPDSRQLIFSLTFNLNKFVRSSAPSPEATPY